MNKDTKRIVSDCSKFFSASILHVQYKSLKVNRNGGKSKKSKIIFVTSPVEDLDSFYQKPVPE